MSDPAEATTAASGPDRPPRTQSREARRAQLIEATIATIAARGLARTTLTEVARAAGLSHGLVLFHFETKEKLLAETLAFLAQEYRDNWQAVLAAARPGPADQLLALIEADFAPAITDPARLAAWCAFWGEAQSRPMYQECCGALDAEHTALLERLCADLAAEGGYDLDPVVIGRILRVCSEGTWIDMMTVNDSYPLAEARRTLMTALALCFPRHFDAQGRRTAPGR